MDQSINSNNNQADPGVPSVRPWLSPEEIKGLLWNNYGFNVLEMSELNAYYDRNYFVKVSPEHGNKFISEVLPDGYVLKVMNNVDTQYKDLFYGQHAMMDWLRQKGIPTQQAVPDIRGAKFSTISLSVCRDSDSGRETEHMVELRSFIPGNIIPDVPLTKQLLMRDGRFVASITNALRDFNHHFKGRYIKWSLFNVPLLDNYVKFLSNEDDRNLIKDVVKTFTSKVSTRRKELPRGYLHGDPNEQNILVQLGDDGRHEICGILDYSHMEYSHPIIELAINIAYMMLTSRVVPQLDAPGYILAGYLRIRPLLPVEWEVLPIIVAGRLAQSAVFGYCEYSKNPDNPYVLTSAKIALPLLRQYWLEGPEQLTSRWQNIVRTCQRDQD